METSREEQDRTREASACHESDEGSRASSRSAAVMVLDISANPALEGNFESFNDVDTTVPTNHQGSVFGPMPMGGSLGATRNTTAETLQQAAIGSNFDNLPIFPTAWPTRIMIFVI